MPSVGRIIGMTTVLVNTSSTQWGTSAFCRHSTVYWLDGQKDGQMDGWVGRQMNSWVGKQVAVWIDGQMDEQMGGDVGRWMDGWVD